MGILNITPDSFSGDGIYFEKSKIENRILKLIEEVADIIDVGGESTGPGSKEVSLKEEMRRIKPVIDYIYKNKLTDKTVFSIDTYKSVVAEYALRHGFSIVNDITALRGDPKMIEVLLKNKPYVILMYSKDPTPRTTKEAVDYKDVLDSVKIFLSDRINVLLKAGFPKDRIIIDPGMGMFVSAKPEYSFEIINRLGELKELGYPICVGVSRKSFLGGKVEERDPISAKWSMKAIENGASIIRIHNVKQMLAALGSP